MTYIPDLESVSYFDLDGPIKSVGYLESSHSYTRGTADPAFTNKLWALIERPYRGLPTFGMHYCSLCEAEGIIGPDGRSSQATLLVPAAECVYETPIWIGHYVQQHGYLPPVKFRDAVLACPPAGSEALRLALIALLPELDPYGLGDSTDLPPFFLTWDAKWTMEPSPEFGKEPTWRDLAAQPSADARPALTCEQLIELHGGLSTERCKWAGCENRALANTALCTEHGHLPPAPLPDEGPPEESNPRDSDAQFSDFFVMIRNDDDST